MIKKVLIVSELFQPLNSIGSIRPSKLAKYLSQAGMNVTVFTSHKTRTNNQHLSVDFKVIYDCDVSSTMSMDTPIESKVKHSPVFKEMVLFPFKKELSMTYRQYLTYKESFSFYKAFLSHVSRGDIDLSEYDSIFTTFGPIGPVLIGMKAKKLNPKIKWINDFRDPMVSQMMPILVKPLYKYIQRKSVESCDWVTTVSQGYKDRIQTSKSINKCKLTPNGFDIDDKPQIPINSQQSKLFDFTYVGALYEGKRDISPLFKALRKMVDEKILFIEDVVFNYAGKDVKYLIQQASKYNMEMIVRDYGFLSRNECLNLQSTSRFLVLSTWNEKGEEGVFPGKFIEYMLMEKPIVSIVDGSLAGAEVSQTIRKYNLGVSYEKADKSTEYELYEWLKAQAVCFKDRSPAIFNADKQKILKTYDWKYIIERFCKLINDG